RLTLLQEIAPRAVGLGLPHPARVVGNEAIWDKASAPHAQQVIAHLVIALLGFWDAAPRHQSVEHLPHRHRRASGIKGLQDGDPDRQAAWLDACLLLATAGGDPVR